MLPRRYFRYATSIAVSFGLCTSLFAGTPIQAATNYTPDVSIQSISPKFVTKTNFSGVKTVQVVSTTTSDAFSVVGLTWVSTIESDTKFQVRVRESGVWSTWNELQFSSDHGVDVSSSEAAGTRMGTDPFMTAPATGIEIVFSNASGIAPKDLKVELIGSQVTSQDLRTLSGIKTFNSSALTIPTNTTPTGGVVARPNIVSRAQWGANESWRDPIPRMGTKIVAGFIHHTASTNNYSPVQAPAQMRALYAYFTKSLKYADMAYNFLVDQYGTVYEGRNACKFGDLTPCDGPSLPVIGAHTAGFNINTFAISAIGNFDTKAPSHPAEMTESIAQLMAWKLAPYGLNPSANATMVSIDTSGSSKYSVGMTAITPVISGHRDVGRTACPGRYLYPLIPAIRIRAIELLAPGIYGASVSPALVELTDPSPIEVTAIIPASGAWTVEITNANDGTIFKTSMGVAKETEEVSYIWDRTDSLGVPVTSGRYFASISAVLPTGALPTVTSEILVATKPANVTSFKYQKASRTKAKLTWITRAPILPVISQSYRISSNSGKTWSKWKNTPNAGAVVTIKKMKKGKTYRVQIRTTNALGTSGVVTSKFKMK